MAPGGHPSARRLLADNLRLIRVMRRLSQTVLAEEAGVTQSLVSAIERGRANPTLDSLERLALVLEVQLGELFDESETRKRPLISAERPGDSAECGRRGLHPSHAAIAHRDGG